MSTPSTSCWSTTTRWCATACARGWKRCAHLRVVAEAGSGPEALALAAAPAVDLVLMD